MGIPYPVIDVHDIRRQRRPDEHIPTAQPFETRLVPCRTLFTAEGELRDQLVHNRIPMFIFDGIPHVTQLLSFFRVQPGKLHIEWMYMPIGVEIKQNAAGLEDTQPFRVRPARMFQSPREVATQNDIEGIIPECQILSIHFEKTRPCLHGIFFEILPGTFHHSPAVVHPRNLMPTACHEYGKKAGTTSYVEDAERMAPRKLFCNQLIPYLGLNILKFIGVDGSIGSNPSRPIDPNRFQMVLLTTASRG